MLKQIESLNLLILFLLLSRFMQGHCKLWMKSYMMPFLLTLYWKWKIRLQVNCLMWDSVFYQFFGVLLGFFLNICLCPGLCAGSFPLKRSLKLSTVSSWDLSCKRESLVEAELAYSHLGFHLCQMVLRKRFGMSFKAESPTETQTCAMCFLIVCVYSWLIIFLSVS